MLQHPLRSATSPCLPPFHLPSLLCSAGSLGATGLLAFLAAHALVYNGVETAITHYISSHPLWSEVNHHEEGSHEGTAEAVARISSKMAAQLQEQQSRTASQPAAAGTGSDVSHLGDTAPKDGVQPPSDVSIECQEVAQQQAHSSIAVCSEAQQLAQQLTLRRRDLAACPKVAL
jgi:hypothetical protein